MQCGIDYFIHSQEIDSKEDYADTAMKLVKHAENVAIGKVIKQRLRDNLRDLLVQSNINDVIQILKGRLSRYSNLSTSFDVLGKWSEWSDVSEEEWIIESSIIHLINIKAILKGSNKNYITLSTNVAAKTLNYIIEAVNNVQRHYPFIIEDMGKRTMSEAWRVTQRISSLDTSIEFQSHYLENKVKLKDICNQIGVNATESSYAKIPQLNFIIQESEITNTENKPLYEEYVRYIGLKLNVVSFETQTVEFFLKYVDPEGKYSFNSEISPKGYTMSSKHTITPNTTIIDFNGWGNSDKCSYKIGKHSIEVWVEGFMIYKKEFTVDLSPVQKIEKEIIDVENKLSEIKNTTFLQTEINSAKGEMTEINKFKLFRSSSTKQKEIDKQQLKIDNLEKQSMIEKETAIKNQRIKIRKLKAELQEATLIEKD